MSLNFEDIFPSPFRDVSIFHSRIRLLQFSYRCVSELRKKEPDVSDVLELYQVLLKAIRSLFMQLPEQMEQANTEDVIALLEVAIATAKSASGSSEPACPERPWKPIIAQAAVDFRRLAEAVA